MYSRLASRFARTVDTNSSTETWSLAASSAALLYKSSGTAMALLMGLFLYCPQNLPRCHHAYSKPLDAREMPDVMRDDGIRAARHGQFENEFVAGVRQDGP